MIGGVAGSDGRDLDPAEAAGHIFGYTIFNDWSARDIQGREMKVRLGPPKGKDFATTLGPVDRHGRRVRRPGRRRGVPADP